MTTSKFLKDFRMLCVCDSDFLIVAHKTFKFKMLLKTLNAPMLSFLSEFISSQLGIDCVLQYYVSLYNCYGTQFSLNYSQFLVTIFVQKLYPHFNLIFICNIYRAAITEQILVQICTVKTYSFHTCISDFISKFLKVYTQFSSKYLYRLFHLDKLF